jgi:hypothetical protein
MGKLTRGVFVASLRTARAESSPPPQPKVVKEKRVAKTKVSLSDEEKALLKKLGLGGMLK